jgi:hypothetical protein
MEDYDPKEDLLRRLIFKMFKNNQGMPPKLNQIESNKDSYF